MTDHDENARLARLQEVRAGMEALHADALAERGGKTSTAEETVAPGRKPDLVIDTMASWALYGLGLTPSALERIKAFVEADIPIEQAINRAKRGLAQPDDKSA